MLSSISWGSPFFPRQKNTLSFSGLCSTTSVQLSKGSSKSHCSEWDLSLKMIPLVKFLSVYEILPKQIGRKFVCVCSLTKFPAMYHSFPPMKITVTKMRKRFSTPTVLFGCRVRTKNYLPSGTLLYLKGLITLICYLIERPYVNLMKFIGYTEKDGWQMFVCWAWWFSAASYSF